MRYKPEEIVNLLQQIEVEVANGKTTPQACRDAGITAQTKYRWRKEFGGLKSDQGKRLKQLEKENSGWHLTAREEFLALKISLGDNILADSWLLQRRGSYSLFNDTTLDRDFHFGIAGSCESAPHSLALKRFTSGSRPGGSPRPPKVRVLTSPREPKPDCS